MPRGRGGRGRGGGGGRGRGGGGRGGSASDKMGAYFEAVAIERLPTVRWSLSNIGSLEASSRNPQGRTAFMVAVENDKPRSLQMLIDFYARTPALREKGWVDCVDERGQTCIMMAAANGCAKCVDILLDIEPKHLKGGGGVLLEAKCHNGLDARAYAVRNKAKHGTAVVELIDDFLAPSEDEAEDGDGGGAGSIFDAAGNSKTAQSKQKRQQLAAAEGDFELERVATREAAAAARKAEKAAADERREAAAATKPDAIWPEVRKIEESIAAPGATICELTVVREEAAASDGDSGAEAVDPALWFLAEAINRLSVRLPKGVLTELPPPGLAKLTALRELILSNNSLAALPDTLGELKELRVLEAQGNELTELPASIANLKHLETLDVCHNKLTSLAPLAPLTNIVTLLVDGNTLASGALCELPCANLGRLATLGASSNPDLAELPDELGLCASLASCNLSDTAVTELPTSITALKKVKVLQMDNCPISDPKVKKKLVDARDGGKALKELWKLIEKQGGKGGKGGKGKKGKKK